MNKIYEILDEIKINLDELEIFKELKEAILKIKNNKVLKEKIEKYNEFPTEELRLEIYKYEEIKKYKHIETEINFLILEINQKLKKINISRSCSNENH